MTVHQITCTKWKSDCGRTWTVPYMKNCSSPAIIFDRIITCHRLNTRMVSKIKTFSTVLSWSSISFSKTIETFSAFSTVSNSRINPFSQVLSGVTIIFRAMINCFSLMINCSIFSRPFFSTTNNLQIPPSPVDVELMSLPLLRAIFLEEYYIYACVSI